jgi:hypothetical protein
MISYTVLLITFISMPELIDVVRNEGIHLINNIRVNLGSTGTNATLKTSQSLRIEVQEEGDKIKLTLFGRPFFTSVRDGRKPTPGKKPSREFVENLRPWADARGIPQEAVWAIATVINRRGTNLWLAGGREDIIEPAVDEFVNNVSQAALDAEADNFQLKLRQMKW